MQIYETMPISVIAAVLCRQPGDIDKNEQNDAATNPDDEGFFFPCAFIPYFHIHILYPAKADGTNNRSTQYTNKAVKRE